MQDANGKRPADLIRRAVGGAKGFEFYQTVRLLSSVSPDASGMLATRRVRFRNSTSLSFAPGDVEAVRVIRDGRAVADVDAAVDALKDPTTEVEITTPVMGLLGGFGALSPSYTERVAESESRGRNGGAKAFFDVMIQRPVSLFYEAWRYHHPELGYELGAESALSGSLRALAGHGLRDTGRFSGPERLSLSDDAMAGICAALRQNPMSAEYLGRILSLQVGETIRVEDCVEAMYELPVGMQTRLGVANSTLGVNMVLGRRVRQRHLRVKLHVGPLRKPRYMEFMPGGVAHELLRRWIRITLGEAYEYEVVPLLHRDDVGGIRLGGPNPARLGYDTFLSSGPSPVHRDDAKYLMKL